MRLTKTEIRQKFIRKPTKRTDQFNRILSIRNPKRELSYNFFFLLFFSKMKTYKLFAIIHERNTCILKLHKYVKKLLIFYLVSTINGWYAIFSEIEKRKEKKIPI